MPSLVFEIAFFFLTLYHAIVFLCLMRCFCIEITNYTEMQVIVRLKEDSISFKIGKVYI